jgi:nitroimidazol reductase NimA-like FMN-containing flavoprotein (pyridoxamine 5'-phosphate oxidase superfamily)
MPSPQNIPASPRTTLKRGKERAVYDPSDIRSILAAGVVAHVGVTTDDGPIVLPMAYGVRDNEILIHGSIANAMMRGGRSVDVCVTVTIIDALVIARTPFHNSMNYRSVVIRGTATAIADRDEQTAALKVINDHIAPIWDTARPPNEQDLKLTMVLSVPLDEASAKVRGGDPIDEPEDMQTDHWAGRLPLQSTWGEPIPAADLKEGVPIPSAVAAMAETEAYQYSSK